MTYDVAILGAGPGGYVAAIRGGQLGAKVCLIEEGDLGGTCLNRGCIPSKAYYQSAQHMLAARRGAEFGVRAALDTFDLSACKGRKDRVVGELVGGIGKLLSGNGVDVVHGRGVLTAADSIQVATTDGGSVPVTARSIILATGSRPMDIPGLPIDGRRIVTSDQIWDLEQLPERMIIVGGGVIGCEVAHAFSAFGTKVTVLELLDRLLFTEEKEASREVQRALTSQGVEVRVGARVAGAAAAAEGVTVTLESGEELAADCVVVAVGRTPNTAGIGLDEVGVALDEKGRIQVNDEMETSVPGVYAVGDAVGRFMLAHVATSEAMVAMHTCLGKPYWMDYDVVPYAVFTRPEVAGVGAKEAELKEAGVPYKVGRFSFGASGKAVAMGEPEGFIKLLSHGETGRVVGATIVGAHASDVIHEVTLAMRMEASPGDLVTTIHVHPTISEVVLEAGEDTMGLAIHKMGRRPRQEG
jgi:dihydrolipoamide dehydrogenase